MLDSGDDVLPGVIGIGDPVDLRGGGDQLHQALGAGRRQGARVEGALGVDHRADQGFVHPFAGGRLAHLVLVGVEVQPGGGPVHRGGDVAGRAVDPDHLQLGHAARLDIGVDGHPVAIGVLVNIAGVRGAGAERAGQQQAEKRGYRSLHLRHYLTNSGQVSDKSRRLPTIA